MTGLGDNILNLARLSRKRDEALANLAEPFTLTLVAPTGHNPGNLRMLEYIPAGLAEGAPLVLVLHGCTQNAAGYDNGSGWSTLAERHGFGLLFVEQQRANSAQLCFNWFVPDDTTRGTGEVESIRQMVGQTVAAHRLDPRRVYVTGLSAGGAMTAAMLATSPELFAGGAIIAGLPYGSAAGMNEAFQAMRNTRQRPAKEWGDLVRAAAPHRGQRPAVQIWQGDADDTVLPGNADALVLQWSNAMGLPAKPSTVDTVDGARHEMWCGTDGRALLERWTVPGLAHGTPILVDGADADRAVGTPVAYMLASSIPSTWHIARSWGLLTQVARQRAAPAKTGAPKKSATKKAAFPAWPSKRPLVAGVIDSALRAAGLLR